MQMIRWAGTLPDDSMGGSLGNGTLSGRDGNDWLDGGEGDDEVDLFEREAGQRPANRKRR